MGFWGASCLWEPSELPSTVSHMRKMGEPLRPSSFTCLSSSSQSLSLATWNQSPACISGFFKPFFSTLLRTFSHFSWSPAQNHTT